LSALSESTSSLVSRRSGAWAESVIDSGRLAPGIGITANLGGLGLGPLLAGFVAQYAGDPLQVPYLVAEGLMLAGGIGLAAAPETAHRPGPRPAYRPQRVSVPPAQRSLFLAAATAAGVEFALFGLFTSLAPSVIAGLLHDSSHALAGAAVSTVLAIAPAGARGEGLAGLFLGAYAGLAVPVVGLGFATQLVNIRAALLGFAAALAPVTGLVSHRLLARAPSASA
jgi:MFS family permease